MLVPVPLTVQYRYWYQLIGFSERTYAWNTTMSKKIKDESAETLQKMILINVCMHRKYISTTPHKTIAPIYAIKFWYDQDLVLISYILLSF